MCATARRRGRGDPTGWRRSLVPLHIDGRTVIGVGHISASRGSTSLARPAATSDQPSASCTPGGEVRLGKVGERPVEQVKGGAGMRPLVLQSGSHEALDVASIVVVGAGEQAGRDPFRIRSPLAQDGSGAP